MNRLTAELARICREHLLAEKWLLAPSLRIGHQWLVAVTRTGQPAVNVHVKTLVNLALELAGPQVAAEKVTLVSPRAGALLVDRVVRRLRQPGSGYFRQLPTSAGLSQAIYSAIDALRRADLHAEQLDPARFDESAKGRELAEILQAYLRQLEKLKLIDRAQVFRLAISGLTADASALPKDLLILVPEDLDPTGLERVFLEALPADRRQRLPVDQPDCPPAGESAPATDAALLRWLRVPAEAPPPFQDHTAAIYRAVGEVNEVREVLRRCLALGHPLDEVELLYTDKDTYVPLIYETFTRLRPDDAGLDELKVTFLEGIPTGRSRPGRALTAWLAWVRDSYPQRNLVQMIQEGLLEIPGLDREEFSFSWLAQVLRSIGIGFGRDRYRPCLAEQLDSLKRQLSGHQAVADEDGEVRQARLAGLERRLQATLLLSGLMEKLLDISPPPHAGQQQILEASRRFLRELARSASELDNYARKKLVEEIGEMEHCLGQDNEAVSLDMWDWLASLPAATYVGGSGPRGGCLHVAPVLLGGHSGRPHTFIVGLDDGRFPGAGFQDPVLLDSERRLLSDDLPTAAGRLEEKLVQFARLLARLRGTVTLSYSCHDLADDRDLFPSPVVLAAFRILSGNHTADQAELVRWLPPAASFAPEQPEKPLDETEWWLWRLSGSQAVQDPRALVSAHFPHLGRGYEAARQRGTADFTVYDGWLPAAGADLDPTSPDGPVLSARGLEMLGRCPRAYFFRYVLGIEPAEELEIDSDRWLDPLTYGALVHAVFERFLSALIKRGDCPEYARDEPLLISTLDEQVARYRRLVPPPNESVYRRQYGQLLQTARIFLREEEEFCRRAHSQPLFLEAAIGMRPESTGTPLDTPDPVPLRLPSGKELRVRGRIDRIDRLLDQAGSVFAIWDYKTGTAWKYRQSPPFWQGRVVQHHLYLELVAARLKALATQFPQARLDRFGFFLPSDKARGKRIEFKPEDLAGGAGILQSLAQIAANGAFLATNDQESECTYCDYRGVCGDVAAVAAASQRKLENPANTLLQPLVELRIHGKS